MRGTPTGGAITLEGIPSYFGIDADGKGLFEWLQVSVPVRAGQAGDYFFDAYISDRQQWLPSNGLDTARDRAQPVHHAELDAGDHTVDAGLSDGAGNEPGTFPDSFSTLEESALPSFSPRKFKITRSSTKVLLCG